MQATGCVWLFVLCFVSFVVTTNVSHHVERLEHVLRANQADGEACLVCEVGLAIIEENVGQNVEFWEDFLLRMCDLLPTIAERSACKVAVSAFGVDVIIHLLETYNPDYICGPDLLNICQQCTIDFVQPKTKQERIALELRSRIIANLLLPLSSGSREVPPDMLPAEDVDGDYFSPVNNLRRTAKWRGRDCDDTSAEIHAGYKDVEDGSVDNNCNGIFGVNSKTGNAYEEDYCEGSVAFSSRRSIVMFGDSAAAGFRIPVEWLNLQNLTTIPETAIQELDFPHMSWSTGYEHIGNDSVYLYMREKNLCNHIDFQNLAKNGAVMEDLAEYQVDSMTPSAYPLLAFIAYIGNDVCDGSLEDMTTPEEFYNEAITGLDKLNAVAAPGSKVALSGLVDGRILWDTLHANIHPLGMTYEDFYNFLTCTGANPCWTWLNSDEAVRNATSARAKELSEELKKIVNDETLTSTWPNLDLVYIPFPVEAILNWMTAKGENPALLIEPVDGFHPSQYAHRLIAKVVWELIGTKYPDFFGQINPHNPLIASTFPNPPPY